MQHRLLKGANCMEEAVGTFQRLSILEGLVNLDVGIINDTRVCKVFNEMEFSRPDGFQPKKISARFLERLNQVLGEAGSSISLYTEAIIEGGLESHEYRGDSRTGIRNRV